MIEASYVVPIRRAVPEEEGELSDYLRRLSGEVDEVIVVDGSPPEVFEVHESLWGDAVRHVPVSPGSVTPMGKVGGVLTGVRLARNERVVIGDDDVFYDPESLARVVALLENAHVVRPQNYFDPLPWHALWDTGRTLLNRLSGGDWPGTLGVRRSALLATSGYDGGAMFENLELVRTVRAAGGVEEAPLDLFVPRRPPDSRHFFSQRVRQAYDEFARPPRMALSLAVLPMALVLAARGRWKTLAAGAGTISLLAEWGRRRAAGREVFPAAASFLAPAWVAERAICSWLALGSRVFRGGIPYGGSVLRLAANSERELRRRHAGAISGIILVEGEAINGGRGDGDGV